MSPPGPILRELHRLRRHARNLQDEIERLPRQLRVQQAKVTRQEDALKQAQETLKKLKVAISDKEKSLKAKHADIARYEKQRDEAAGKKEYDALQHEITAARQACRQLEDEAMAGLLETEERTAQLPELEKALREAKQEVADFDKTSAARQAVLSEELKRVQQQIAETEATLPEDVRINYARQVAARGEDALALVSERNCTACYTAITAQMYNELVQGRYVPCRSCGRILYLPE